MAEFEFLSAEDRPALLALSSPEYLSAVSGALIELEYKMHAASSHDEFIDRFGQLQYEVVIIEETFGTLDPKENRALTTLQEMQMSRRRHATIILLGDSFETMNAMQAFQQSVHAVINRMDLDKIKPILQQAIQENTTFLSVFRDVQARQAQGKR